MKVTVCFGTVRVVVPCGAGDLTVGELMEKAVIRYRKATCRNEDYWIRMVSLKSDGEDGILDSDDLVCDVADDREKLIATFQKQDGPPQPTSAHHRPHHHLITDGGTSTCTSSVGTDSPLNFNHNNSLEDRPGVGTEGVAAAAAGQHANNSNNKMLANHYGGYDENSDVDVVVTGEELASDLKLHVRRGSDPVMPVVNGDPQRWNGNAGAQVDSNANTLQEKRPSQEIIQKRRNSKDIEANGSAFSRFGRDSSRQSISGVLDGGNMYKWAEAQQRMENKESKQDDPDNEDREEIVIRNDGTPLGIQIIARIENDDDSAYGLVIHGIETGGRAARDGRLHEGDHILTINKLDITEMTFDGAQELLRDAMRTDSVTLTVEHQRRPGSEPTSPSSDAQMSPVVQAEDDDDDAAKVPPVVPARAPATSLTKEDTQKVHNIIAPTNTRRIGRKLYVQLMKGPQGLGFSITTRDNAVGGKNPIYIKNILPKGAALADGRCKAGDRLLEVNGIEMTGKSQSEAVSILRSVRLGGVVNLVLSRQDPGTPATPEKILPRALPEDKNTDDPTSAKNKAVLVFDIPLNDTGSAGLGVSVKGKTSGGSSPDGGESKDLGIFIKSVIHGGAASKDGRLRPNDQLLYINEESLVGVSNSRSMEILRRSMSGDKSPRATIRLVVARRMDPTAEGVVQDDPAAPGHARADSTEDGSYQPGSPVSISSRGIDIDMDAMDELFRHPVLNRLNALKKDEATAQRVGPGGDAYVDRSSHLSPTMPNGGSDVVMIDDADIDNALDEIDKNASRAAAPSPPQWLVDTWEKAKREGDNGDLSPIDDPYNEFQRDSFARRSFSERHKGSLDAKEMAWYKGKKGSTAPEAPATKTALNKREPADYKDIAISTSSLVKSSSTDNLADHSKLSSLHQLSAAERKDIGPSLGLKKNSSLESLQAAVAEVTTLDDLPSRLRTKVVRGRGCNESFRAAVDRSYDQPLNGNALNGPFDTDYSDISPTRLRNDRPSNHSPSAGSNQHEPVVKYVMGSPKKTNSKKELKDKRKGGAFKGFGSMFRFGKNRKLDHRDGKPADEERPRSSSLSSTKSKQEDVDKYKEEQHQQSSRIQDEVRRLREQQPQPQPQPQSLQRRKEEESLEARSKAERMQELRQKYQRYHREREGRYVDDHDDDGDRHGDGGDDGSRDKEDEGYGDGSPTSPRSLRPGSPDNGEFTDRRAPKYRDYDHDRWERQSETNLRGGPPNSGSGDDASNERPHRHSGDSYEPKGRHRYGRHSVPAYIETRPHDPPPRHNHPPKEVHPPRRARPDRQSEPTLLQNERTIDRSRPLDVHYEALDHRASGMRSTEDLGEPQYASVVRKSHPDRRDERSQGSRPEKGPPSHYEVVEIGEREIDAGPARRTLPEKIYETASNYQRGRDEPPGRGGRSSVDRGRDEKYWNERNRNDDRHREERYSRSDRHRGEEGHREDRYRNNGKHHDEHREDGNRGDNRHHDDNHRGGGNRHHADNHHGNRHGEDRKDESRQDAKKHNNPDKLKNGGGTLGRKASDPTRDAPKRKEARDMPKHKDSDTLKRKDSDKAAGKKAKSKETEKDEAKSKDKKKDKKKKDLKKTKNETVSSDEEEEDVELREKSWSDEPPRNDRRGAAGQREMPDRRHHGERDGGDGMEYDRRNVGRREVDRRDVDRREVDRREDNPRRDNSRREEGRYDPRDRQRSPPPAGQDKYGYASLGRPTRKQNPNGHDDYHRGIRESGYQSDYNRGRGDPRDNGHPSNNPKGYANGPTSSHYPLEERRSRTLSSQGMDQRRGGPDGYHGGHYGSHHDDYRSLKHLNGRHQDHPGDSAEAARV